MAALGWELNLGFAGSSSTAVAPKPSNSSQALIMGVGCLTFLTLLVTLGG